MRKLLNFVLYFFFTIPLMAQGIGGKAGIGGSAGFSGGCAITALAPSGGSVDNNGGAWSGSGNHGIVTANAGTAPDCTNNATNITEDSTASSSHYGLGGQYVFSLTAASHTYTLSVARAVGTRNVGLILYNSSFANTATVGVNLATCANNVAATATGAWSAASATYTSLSPAWCTIKLTVTTTSDTGIYFGAQLLSGTLGTYNGDGMSSILVWGADFR
jgi:hypothetical protein